MEAQDRCLAMMSRDYMVSLIPNTFCRTYPNDIILLGNLNPEGEEPIKAGELIAHEEFGAKLKEMMEASKHCRCHQRIPVPVLVVRNKILARSAGLSDALENIYETRSMSSFKYALISLELVRQGQKQWTAKSIARHEHSHPPFLPTCL